MTVIMKTPILNPMWKHYSIEDCIISEGFEFLGEIDNDEYVRYLNNSGFDRIKEFINQRKKGEISDFRIILSYFAKDGEAVSGREDCHCIYVKYK